MLSRRVHGGHLLLAALVVVAAMLAGRAWRLLATPLPAAPVVAPALVADLQLLATHDPFFPAAGSDPAPVTTLALSLHGVRSDSRSGRGSAIIAGSDGEQKVYDVGDDVQQGVKLVAIAGDHVILEQGGARQSLWLDAGSDTPVQRFDPDTDVGDATVADAGGLPASDAPAEAAPAMHDAGGVPGAAVMAAVPPPRTDRAAVPPGTDMAAAGAPGRPRR